MLQIGGTAIADPFFFSKKAISVQMAADIEAISPRGVPRSVVHLGSVTCSLGTAFSTACILVLLLLLMTSDFP